MGVSEQEALLAAGKLYPGAQIWAATLHPLLQELAGDQAARMARWLRQGHQGFPERSDRIYRELGLAAAEIAAESWPEQAEAPLADIAKGMFDSWKQSPGHWAIVSAPHKLAGCDMARGRNGTWYACWLVAD